MSAVAVRSARTFVGKSTAMPTVRVHPPAPRSSARARTQIHSPFKVCISVIDRIGMRAGQQLGHRREGIILWMNQRIDIAKGHELAGRRHAKHLVHRIRPVDTPACEIPIPQAAASPAKRGVDSVLHPVAQYLACAEACQKYRDRQNNQYKDRADRKHGCVKCAACHSAGPPPWDER
jgi:hypothetical protein